MTLRNDMRRKPHEMQLNRRAAIESPHVDELVVIALRRNAQHLVTKCTTNLIVVHEVPRAASDPCRNDLFNVISRAIDE